MTRRLLILNGIAIIAVVINHAAGWGFTAMFWWTNRYLPVSIPNFDQFGSLTYYLLVILRQITVFSVPAFLFVSGVFISYAARGEKSKLNLKTIRMRLIYLLVPYLIWSLIIFVVEFMINGETFTITEYLRKLLLGQSTPAYFYVIVIFQFYLISPLIVLIARYQWMILLLI